MFYLPWGTLIACCSVFYGLMAVEKLSLPCKDDPDHQFFDEGLQTFLQFAFYIHLASFFFSASLFPYFDHYSNCSAIVQKEIERGNINSNDSSDIWRRVLKPYVVLLEQTFRVAHVLIGII